MESILVTGGAGNIGSSLVTSLLLNTDANVVVADNLSTGSTSKLPDASSRLVFIKCDVNNFKDISALFFTFRFTHVFHLAAVVGVQRTLSHPLRVLADVRGIENILKLSKNTGVHRAYFSSSSEVYGEPFEVPQNEETTPLNSRLPYAVVKNLGEVYFQTYQREFGLDYTIFRFFNTYGPGQSEDFVLPRFVHSALKGDPLYVYGEGTQSRTFCYVEDSVEACIAAHCSHRCANVTINIGSDEEVSIRDLAQLVIRISGSSSPIEFLPPLPEGDMTRRRPDIGRMKQLLGRQPLDLEEGIFRLVAHYRSLT